ncbi:hypothetical protein I5M27_11375 [Adhaeribacter sp. BT258]|uniref:Lipoprotein n=1 Tax=Adhaeribacter terrigena TaxID=2793070 RepID=A0ABS1C2M6_9BACT|nr:hypothetical protein [Adhaeribacter terrigena]MBK0403590.1 hypothetical protein [Adhaeribacter terrigena]
MRHSVTLIFALFLASCSSSKTLKSEKLIGKYSWKLMDVGGETIELKNDKTFEYTWVTGLAGGETNGSWKIEKNQIIFNSELQPLKESEKYEVLEGFAQTDDSLLIKVTDQYNLPLPYASCVLKSDTTVIAWANTNSKGEAKLPRVNADSLIIPWIGFYTIRHSLDKSFSQYEFKMKDKPEFYQYFTNEIWTYNYGRLYPPVEKLRYSKKDSFKRIK